MVNLTFGVRGNITIFANIKRLRGVFRVSRSKASVMACKSAARILDAKYTYALGLPASVF